MSALGLSSREQAVFGHFPSHLWVGSFWAGSVGNQGPGSLRYSAAVETGSSAERGWRSAAATGLGCCSAEPDLGLGFCSAGPDLGCCSAGPDLGCCSAGPDLGCCSAGPDLGCCSAGPGLGLAPEVTGPRACSDWIPAASGG